MNQDIRDALARLTHALENEARANDLLRTRLQEQEQIAAKERERADRAEMERAELEKSRDEPARARRITDLVERLVATEAERDSERRRNVELEVQLNQTYAHWRDARGAEILLVRNDLEETRRVNRRLLEDYANLSAQLSQAHAECSQAYAERDIFLAAQRAVCDVLSYDSGTIAGQTLVEAVRAVIAQRDSALARLAAFHAAAQPIIRHTDGVSAYVLIDRRAVEGLREAIDER